MSGNHHALHVLGITGDALRVYEALLARSPASADDLAGVLNEPAPGVITGLLADLDRLGLATSLADRPDEHIAIRPDIAIEALLLGAELALAETRRDLTRLATRHLASLAEPESGIGVQVLIGAENILQCQDNCFRTEHSDICYVDAPPYISDPNQLNTLEVDQLASGCRVRVLYNRGSLNLPTRLPDLEAGISAGEEARIGDLPIKMSIYDNTQAILIGAGNGVPEHALYLRNPILVRGLRDLFDASWEDSVGLKLGEHTTFQDPGPNDTDRILLTKLAAGATDTEIGAELGWTERTVRRHLVAICERLGATTRFQAGYQAYRRGWLRDADRSTA
ncbi:helix-turn-helix transcriptional regulator [Nakamurella lactea]|uniref:helix-turn-helix transcriptional regulator n=1 Tax=Nakamurella lactea TaxID=459515 RepID=UPI0012B562B9|nr:LuxR family transcriptional regulator [Nakamurella lactea]